MWSCSENTHNLRRNCNKFLIHYKFWFFQINLFQHLLFQGYSRFKKLMIIIFLKTFVKFWTFTAFYEASAFSLKMGRLIMVTTPFHIIAFHNSCNIVFLNGFFLILFSRGIVNLANVFCKIYHFFSKLFSTVRAVKIKFFFHLVY